MSSLIIPIDDNALKEAYILIKRGELVCFPTETVYALAADARNEEAVQRIYEVKGRNHNKPLSLLVPDLNVAEQVAVFSEKAKILARHFWPGPLTLVLPAKPGQFASSINQQGNSIGIRIPDHSFALILLSRLNGPLVGTSANLSGEENGINAAMINAQLGNKVPLIIDGGPSLLGVSSTVVDMTGDELRILREGTLTKAELMQPLTT